MHSVLATLDRCRTVLAACGERETELLLSVAILGLRMKLNRITDAELKALCDAMSLQDTPAQRSREPRTPHGERRRPLLKLV